MTSIMATGRSARRETIPDDVKIFVWRRDERKCVKCGSEENLEFDHIIPISKGGSNTARNIQILCEHCNREKGDSIALSAGHNPLHFRVDMNS
jgi:5-methylcytosine-specific restriction endonuclease McrA